MDFLQGKLLCCLMLFSICLKSLGNCAVSIVPCQPGQRKKHNSGICVPCPSDQFMAQPNTKEFCTNCGTCDEASGSVLISKCTRTADTVCRCPKGLVPSENDPGSCRCSRGSQFDMTEKKCKKCPQGYFNTHGKKCKPWKDCGTWKVKTPGSHESDVICDDSPGKNRTSVTQDPTFPSVHDKQVNVSVAVPMTSPITTTALSPSITPSTSTSPPSSLRLSTVMRPVGNTGFPGYAIAMPPVLLLIFLSPIICKKIIIPFIQNYKKKADTPCRRPIEESGDSSCSSLVKSCQGQP